MNRVISWMQNAFVRVVVSLSIVGMAFLFNVALGFDNSFQAQAEPYTPEATQYQVNSKESPFRENVQEKVNEIFEDNKNPQTAPETTQKIGDSINKPVRETKEKAEGILDTIKEKLNLDQPIYPGTKEFINDVQEQAEETVKGTQQAIDDAVF